MAKGIKRIKWNGHGKVFSKMSTPNKKVVIAADEDVFFEVDLWYDGTTEADKKKNITWILQDRKKNTIIVQKIHYFNIPQKINIPKPLCGQFEYYVEASLSGKRDLTNTTGLLVSGHCPAKITSHKWCKTNDSADVGKEYLFKFGENIYLNLMTEGLNGHLNLSVDIFQKGGNDKKPLHRYTSIDVIDGEINLAIKNTFTWYSNLKNVKENEEFYVKVFDPAINVYITNNKNETIHARYLKINKKVVSKEVKPPTNLSPLKTGEPEENKERFELCRFETITITQNKKSPVRIFNNGEKLKGEYNIKMSHLKTILFDFDKHDITPESRTVINNVLQYLLGSQNSIIKIDGHACVIGKEQYNQKLSQQRSDAVKKLFVEGGLDAKRIISIGRGEINATDDKKGRDNIKYKDEKEYRENRRVDIFFDSYGHDAQTIIYETTAPSENEDTTIDITDYQNTACLKQFKHKKNIKVISPNYKTMDEVANKLVFPIRSELAASDPAPLQYIWPRYNLSKIGNSEKSIDSSSSYFIHAHSCRYFSNESNSTVQVKAYPDIKWSLEFFLNLTNDLSVKWTAQSDYKLKELQSKAGKIGAERRWKQKEASVGFSFKAKWNNDKQTKELKKQYETKIKKLYYIFSSVGALSDAVTNKTKGAVSSISPKGLPLSFVVKPPNLSFTGEWYLSHPKDNKLILGTDVKLTLKASPLIGLEVTIDLLGAAVFVAGEIVSFGTAGPQALELYKKIQSKLKKGINIGNDKVGVKTSVDIYMDLIITGTIGMTSEFKFNTAGKAKDSDFKLASENKLKLELKVGVKIKGEAVIVIVKAQAYFEASGTASASITFGHGIIYDEKGLYYRPKLGFDGLDIKYIIQVSASLAVKIAKDGYKIDEKKEGKHTFAEGEFIGFIPPFDVVKELEELFQISANIPLIKNN